MVEPGPEELERVDIKKEMIDVPQAAATPSCICKCESNEDISETYNLKTEYTMNSCSVLVKTEPVDCKPFKCDICQNPVNQHNISPTEGQSHPVTMTTDLHSSVEDSQSIEGTNPFVSGQELAQLDDKHHKCELCDYGTRTPSKLKVHIRTHTGERPYKCDLCSYSAKQIGHLDVHKRIHTGDRPYPCSLCDYRGILPSHLKAHMLTHTDEKRYKCDMCSYSAGRNSVLAAHKRTHTGEKPYPCSLCNYRASQKSTLKRHTMTHTGEKPYRCDYCDYIAKVEDALVKHIRSRHLPPPPQQNESPRNI